MADLVEYALTSVDDVKESLGIASSDTSWDNLITRKINQVTDLIESYCQRRFAVTAYTEEYKGSQIDELVLKQRPIVVDDDHTFLMEWRNTAFNDDNFETIEPELYFIDTDAGVLNLMFGAVGYWNRYRITYSAGYIDIPNDLAEGANMLVCFFVNNPSGSNIGVQEKQEGQRRTRFFPTPNSFKTIVGQLGLDETLDAYADTPVLTDR